MFLCKEVLHFGEQSEAHQKKNCVQIKYISLPEAMLVITYVDVEMLW